MQSFPETDEALQVLFLSILPVVAVDPADAAFAVDFATPREATFLALPGAAFRAAAVFAIPAAFRSTVFALPSLDSSTSLALRVVRVPGLDRGPLGAVVAVRFVRAVGVAELALEFDVVVTFLSPPARAPAPATAAVGRAGLPPFKGELALYKYDLVGEVARLRFASRELDDVGDKTCAGRTTPASPPRAFFLGFSPTFSFSLSLVISSLVSVSL